MFWEEKTDINRAFMIYNITYMYTAPIIILLIFICGQRLADVEVLLLTFILWYSCIRLYCYLLFKVWLYISWFEYHAYVVFMYIFDLLFKLLLYISWCECLSCRFCFYVCIFILVYNTMLYFVNNCSFYCTDVRNDIINQYI